MAVLGLLAGCATPNGAGLADIARPLAGGVIASPLGSDLPKGARAAAVAAEYRALETGAPGVPVAWRSSDETFGSVVPQQTFVVGASTCRRYIHTISVEGTQRSGSGTACRGEDGRWTPLS